MAELVGDWDSEFCFTHGEGDSLCFRKDFTFTCSEAADDNIRRLSGTWTAKDGVLHVNLTEVGCYKKGRSGKLSMKSSSVLSQPVNVHCDYMCEEGSFPVLHHRGEVMKFKKRLKLTLKQHTSDGSVTGFWSGDGIKPFYAEWGMVSWL